MRLQALEILESIGAVEVRKIGNEFYYAFKREVDQAASVSQAEVGSNHSNATSGNVSRTSKRARPMTYWQVAAGEGVRDRHPYLPGVGGAPELLKSLMPG